MVFKLKDKDSYGFFNIYLDGMWLSYFVYEGYNGKHVTTVKWSDVSDLYSHFYSLLPYNKECRNRVNNNINQNSLYKDFTNQESELIKTIYPLLKLFKGGRYVITFSTTENKNFFKYYGSLNYEYDKFRFLISPQTIVKESEEKIWQEYQQNIVHGKLEEHSGILYSTTNRYVSTFGVKFLLATMPTTNIDWDRVAFFESEIKNGKRPFIITFQVCCGIDANKMDTYPEKTAAENESENYVIDGHHKLLAYEKLNIYPPVLSIKECHTEYWARSANVDQIEQALYSWQIDDIKKSLKY